MTDKQAEFRKILREFSEVTREVHDTYAYATGYLESLAGQMLADLPRAKQQQYIDEMGRALIAHQRQAEESAK
jgi:hypothetical protein